MKNLSTSLLLLLALAIAPWTNYCLAESVIDFRTYKASTATTLVGQGTDDPVIGDSANAASTAFVIGYLPTPVVLGAETGATVTLSFGVSFNDAAGMANAGDNFRFALFDFNGEGQDSATGGASGGPDYAAAGTDNTDNFRGYWLGVKNGTGVGSGGSIRERIAMLASGQNAFAATGANSGTVTSLGSVGGDPVTLVSDVNGDGAGADYTGVLTLTRNVSGLVDVSGSFIGSNAATGNVFAASDMTANDSSTYGAIGFLIGGPLMVDQVFFQDVNVTVGSAQQLGDYNEDGAVDAADYVVWRRDFGDQQRYDDWRGNFGTTSPGDGSGNGGTAVPEPAAWCLLVFAAMIAFASMSRRSRYAVVLAAR